MCLSHSQLEAQPSLEKFFLKKYLDSGSTSDNHSFWVVQLNSSTPDSIRKKYQSLAVRKLSTSLYVIKGTLPHVSALANKTAWVNKANNLWKLSPVIQQAQKDQKEVFRYTIEVSDVS